MSDETAWFTPEAPRFGADATSLAEGLAESSRPGFGAYLGAQFQEGAWGTIAGQVRANSRLHQAEVWAPQAELAPLDRTAWQDSAYARPGLDWREGMTIAAARAQAEIYDENQARRSLIASRGAGLAEGAAGLVAGIAGGLATPENFIPFAGPAMQAARAQRAWAGLRIMAEGAEAWTAGTLRQRLAAGAALGALDATGGNLVAMPFTVAGREGFGDEVTWADMVQDLAFGAAGGALLGGTLGAALGRPARAPAAPSAPTLAPGAAEAPSAPPGAPLAPAPHAQADDALRALVQTADQVASGLDVNLAMAPPEVRAALEAAQRELAELRAAAGPTITGDGVADRAAARVGQAAGAAAPGAEWRASTPAGMEVAGRYEVVEAADLITSHTADFQTNPAFAAELQPRERGREEAQAQVANIAARLRPEEIEASPLTTTGAPIVGPDGLVESGNGRSMAVRQAYAQGLPTAEAYRAYLVRQGFTDAAHMQAPVLIRRRTTELDAAGRRRFTAESNADTVARMTAGEQARVDAGRLTSAELLTLQPGALDSATNGAFIRAFVQALPDSERGAISSGGELTPDGLVRVQRALAARAYGDAALIRRMSESRDGAAETLGKALLDAAPALARLRAMIEAGQVRPELDSLPALVRAVQRIQAARDANLPLRSVLDQLDMFDGGAGPAERAWLQLLLRHPVREEVGGVGRQVLAARLEAYAKAAAEAPNDGDMFGGPPPGLGDVLRVAFREAGLDAPAELRGLTADLARPPELIPEPPPPGEGGPRQADPVAAAAERLGFDIDARAAELEAARLIERGELPPELVQQIEDAAELAATMEKAPEIFEAAAACAIRG